MTEPFADKIQPANGQSSSPFDPLYVLGLMGASIAYGRTRPAQQAASQLGTQRDQKRLILIIELPWRGIL